jgi:hypothetical protein
MADPVNTQPVALEISISPSAKIDLNEQWIAYLDTAEVPGCVDGIDQSMNYGDDTGTAYA